MFKKKSQSILDFVLVFVAILALFIGIVRIWVWFNANYAKRQNAFQIGRLYAGNVTTYEALGGPVEIGQTLGSTCSSGNCYKPIDLTPEWVFEGNVKPWDRVSLTVEGEIPPTAVIEGECTTECSTECSGYEEDMDACPCFVKCVCRRGVLSQAQQSYNAMIATNASMSEQLRAGARKMKEAVEDCDDWWDPQYWVFLIAGESHSCDELDKQADEMYSMADDLEFQNIRLEAQLAGMEECCKKEDFSVQNECLEKANTDSCDNLRPGFGAIWEKSQDLWRGEQETLMATQSDILNVALPACAEEAEQATAGCTIQCGVYCTWPFYQYFGDSDCIDKCVVDCKEEARNNCCKRYSGICATGEQCSGPWGRKCDTPNTACDNSPSATKCGLSIMASEPNGLLQRMIKAKQSAIDCLEAEQLLVAGENYHCCTGGGNFLTCMRGVKDNCTRLGNNPF